jgi:hypothetical protein
MNRKLEVMADTEFCSFVRQFNTFTFGLTRPSSLVIEYSPPEVVALLCQSSPM